MSDALKAKIKQSWEAAFNQGQLDGLDAVVASQFVRYRPPYSDIESREALKQHIAECRASYPDVHVTIDRVLIDGDWGALFWTYAGTQSGPSPTTGAPHTHRFVTFGGCNIFRWAADHLVEEWEHGDYLGLLQQLGVVSLPK